MPGIIQALTTDEISVGNDGGVENSLNLLIKLKIGTWNENQANTCLSAVRDWFRTYTTMSGTKNSDSTDTIHFSDFKNSAIFGVNVAVKSETGTGGWNYDNRGDGGIRFTPIYGGMNRSGTFTIGFQGGTGEPAAKAEYRNYQPAATGEDAVPVDEQIFLQAETAGANGNNIKLEGSDSVRPSFEGEAAVPKNVELQGPVVPDGETGSEIIINGNGINTISEIITDENLTADVTIVNGGDVKLRNGAQVTIPAGEPAGDAPSVNVTVPGLITFTFGISEDDPYGNEAIKFTGDSTKTIADWVAEFHSNRVFVYPDGSDSVVLFTNEEITVGGGSTDATIENIADAWNARNPNNKVVVLSPNKAVAPSADQIMQLIGGQNASGGSAYTGRAAKTFDSLGRTATYSHSTDYKFTIQDDTTGYSFNVGVNLGTTTGTGNTYIYTDGADPDSPNSISNGQISSRTLDISETSNYNTSTTLLSRPVAILGPIGIPPV